MLNHCVKYSGINYVSCVFCSHISSLPRCCSSVRVLLRAAFSFLRPLKGSLTPLVFVNSLSLLVSASAAGLAGPFSSGSPALFSARLPVFGGISRYRSRDEFPYFAESHPSVRRTRPHAHEHAQDSTTDNYLNAHMFNCGIPNSQSSEPFPAGTHRFGTRRALFVRLCVCFRACVAQCDGSFLRASCSSEWSPASLLFPELHCHLSVSEGCWQIRVGNVHCLSSRALLWDGCEPGLERKISWKSQKVKLFFKVTIKLDSFLFNLIWFYGKFYLISSN